MATTVAELVARLVADTSQFRRGLSDADAAVRRQKSSLESLGQSAQNVGRRLTLGVSLPLAAAGVLAFKELENASRVAAQTTAVIKSTGGVANVTATEVRDLASAISEKSGLDDEAVASAENLLLTFKNVRDEVGKGNDVFKRATQAAVDLSVAGFGDMSSTAKMLGKALNDPVQGLTAMRRAGVTFSKSQTETIKGLVETGDLLTAQKLILREVESQVGGSADAYGNTLPGALGKARESLLNAAASILETALPAFKAIAAGAKEFADFVRQAPAPVRALIGTLAGIAAVVGPALYVFGAIVRNVAAIQDQFPKAATAIGGFMSKAAPLLKFGGMIAGSALAVYGITEALKALNTSIVETATSAKNVGSKSFGELTRQLRDLKSSVDQAETSRLPFMREGSEANRIYGEMKNNFRDLAAENEGLALKFIASAEAAGLPAKEVARLKAIVTEFTTAEEGAGTALLDTAKDMAHQGRQAELTKGQIKALKDEALSLLNSQLGLHGAYLNVESAVQSYKDAVAEHGAQSLEARQAEQNYAQSIMAVAASTEFQKKSISDQIATLEFLKGTLAPGSPLLAAIDGYIIRLAATQGPWVANVSVTGVEEAEAKLRGLAATAAAAGLIAVNPGVFGLRVDVREG